MKRIKFKNYGLIIILFVFISVTRNVIVSNEDETHNNGDNRAGMDSCIPVKIINVPDNMIPGYPTVTQTTWVKFSNGIMEPMKTRARVSGSWSQTLTTEFNNNSNTNVQTAIDRVRLKPTGQSSPSSAFSNAYSTFQSPGNNIALLISDGTYYYNGYYDRSTVNVYGTGRNGTTLGSFIGSFNNPTYGSGAAYVYADNSIYFIPRTTTTTISKGIANGSNTTCSSVNIPTGGPSWISLISSTPTQFLMLSGNVVYFVNTSTWSVSSTVTLSSSPNYIDTYGSSFAYDGSYFYFSVDCDNGDRDYTVYNSSGTYVGQYTASYNHHGCYFDWMASEYIASDGYGTYSPGITFGPNTGNDSNPISRQFQSSGITKTPTISSGLSSTNWDVLNFTKDVTSPGTSLTVDVLNANTGETLLTNVLSGTDLSDAGISTSINAIKLRANLSTSNTFYTPELLDWSVDYHFNSPPNKPIHILPEEDSNLNTNTPIFKWTFSDPEPGDTQGGFTVEIADDEQFSNVNYTSGDITSTISEWTPDYALDNGIWYWRVRTKDNGGVWGLYSTPSKFIIDTQKPVSVVTTPKNNKFINDLDFIFGICSDGVKGSGVNYIEITLKRESDNYYWNVYDWFPLETWLLVSGSYNWSLDTRLITWTSNERYCIRTRATDMANNVETPTPGISFIYDDESPTTIIDSIANNSKVNKLLQISGNSTDTGGSEIENIIVKIKSKNENQYWDGSAWNSIDTWVLASGVKPWSYDTSRIQWTSGAEYIIYVKACDRAGNEEFPTKIASFLFDTEAPNPVYITINTGDEYTNSTRVTLSLQADDKDSGVAAMSFSNNEVTWSDWKVMAAIEYFDLTNEEGQNFVYFRVKDHAGNIAETVFDSIILDTIPPQINSIKINDYSGYTNSEIVTIQLDAIDFGSGLKDMTFSSNGFTWLPWEIYNPTKYFILPSGEGEKVIYFKIRDSANNIATTSKLLTLDNTPPHSTSVSINGGKSVTKSNIVVLTISSTDDLSGVYQVSFSLDGTTWSAWEGYNKTKSYLLPEGDGTKTVYVKVKDNAGNIGEPVSDSIKLKTSSESGQLEGAESLLNIWIFLIIIVIIVVLLIILIFITKRAPKYEEYARSRPTGQYDDYSRGRSGYDPAPAAARSPDRSVAVDVRDTSIGSKPLTAETGTGPYTAPPEKTTVSYLEPGSYQPEQPGAVPTTDPQAYQVPQLPSAQTQPETTPTPVSTPKVQQQPQVISTTPTPTPAPTVTPTTSSEPAQTGGSQFGEPMKLETVSFDPEVHSTESQPKPQIQPQPQSILCPLCQKYIPHYTNPCPHCGGELEWEENS